jgi:hypothetical protein
VITVYYHIPVLKSKGETRLVEDHHVRAYNKLMKIKRPVGLFLKILQHRVLVLNLFIFSVFPRGAFTSNIYLISRKISRYVLIWIEKKARNHGLLVNQPRGKWYKVVGGYLGGGVK